MKVKREGKEEDVIGSKRMKALDAEKGKAVNCRIEKLRGVVESGKRSPGSCGGRRGSGEDQVNGGVGVCGERKTARKDTSASVKSWKGGEQQGSLTCHQCQRNDKSGVSGYEELDASVKLKGLKYMLYNSLPVLHRIYEEQTAELGVESKLQGSQLTDTEVTRIKLDWAGTSVLVMKSLPTSTTFNIGRRKCLVLFLVIERFPSLLRIYIKCNCGEVFLISTRKTTNEVDTVQDILFDLNHVIFFKASPKAKVVHIGNMVKELYLLSTLSQSDNCHTSIVNYYRSCSNPECAYDLCLACCQELRNGHLPGGERAETSLQQFMDRSNTHASNEEANGGKYQKAESKNKFLPLNNFTAATSSNFSQWKANSDGNIPCPPKELGGCGRRELDLRRISKPIGSQS
ncbi:Lysine-specific demethylase JMJ27-like protein [Drosera capensis]